MYLKKNALVLPVAILWMLAGGVAGTILAADCNGLQEEPEKWCKDPFTKCDHHSEANCDGNTGDDPAWIVPGCYPTGGMNDHCDSLQSQDTTECNRIVDCYWSEFYCSSGEPTTTPTYTTYYYSDGDCSPPPAT